MSAVFGMYFLDGRPAQKRDLTAMAERLSHRGPDGVGIWREGAVGIGHRMLCTTRQSLGERLPLVMEGGRFVLTADARIDNRKELISSLGLSRGRDEEIRDAELILAAYQRWGDQAPEHLVGDFAFALWDGRRHTILCARDPMGVRPLYYHHRADGLFAFASETKALAACADVSLSLNERRVAAHLLGDLPDTTSTFYDGIVRLPAAHSIVIGPESAQVRRYWTLDCSRELRLRSDGEYAEAFREHFLEAVRARTRSAFPVGSTLSGGLDSSSIACGANLVLAEEQRPLRTFSAIFPALPLREQRRIDERSYIDAVLATGQFDHTYVRADQTSPLLDWQRVFWHLGEACLAPNLYMHWGLYKAAASKGVRVFLDGVDGDTTVSHGLGHLTDLARAGRWFRFWNEAKALSTRYPAGYPLRSVVRQFGIRALLPGPAIRAWKALRPESAHAEDVQPVISRPFAEQLGVGHLLRGRRNNPTTSSGQRRSHQEGLTSPLIPYTLELADSSSAAFGLEARYPFFDRRLIEFCLSLPGEQKLHEGWTRMVMRRGMADILPPAVQWRIDKADLSANFLRSLFEKDRALIEDVVFSQGGQLQNYVDASAVQGAFRRWSSHPLERQRDALTLYSVTALALWLETSQSGKGRRTDEVFPKADYSSWAVGTSGA
jgi:asparagine synthase (glutamine-hydrolysing)